MSETTYVGREFKTDLFGFCRFAKEKDCVTISEWHNREGFDLIIERESSEVRSVFITYAELKAIKALLKMIKKDHKLRPKP